MEHTQSVDVKRNFNRKIWPPHAISDYSDGEVMIIRTVLPWFTVIVENILASILSKGV